MSKLALVKNAVTSKVGRQVLLGKKHSPTVLFVAGSVGVVTSTVLACRATLKLEAALEHLNKDADNAHDVRELARLGKADFTQRDYNRVMATIKVRKGLEIAKLYSPAITVGALSICALGGSHMILTKRNAGLMAAYAALDKGFMEYRERVIEEIGVEEELKLRHASEYREVEERKEDGTTKTVAKRTTNSTPSIYARMFDRDSSQTWSPDPDYNIVTLRSQQNIANDRLHANGYLLLNDVYESLGLERTSPGCVVGWVLDRGGNNYVDFGIFNGVNKDRFYDFVEGREGAILLDFNVDGVVYDLIDKPNKKVIGPIDKS